ncbi:hypothetical protein SH2C18_35120 [Clostridium sediminicola]|uniref:hypothetical protein n=1 Tax=Clostridium sediminicola TaxID=3114879 RepID=UPI0031F214CD
MKKIKTWGLITAVALIFVAIVIGVLNYNTDEIPKNDLLTQKTIIKTLKKHGVSLKEDRSKSSNDFELSGVKPAIFSVDNGKGTLLVYTFKSIGERKDIISNSGKYDNQFSLFEIPLKAKNAYLVYIVSAPENPTTEEWKSMAEPIHLISNTVFKYLNDGKEIIFKGESESWEGTFTLKYYKHWWHNEKGMLKIECHSEELPEIQYKMTDITDVGPIIGEYKTTSGGGSITGATLDKDGYLNLGHGSSNGAIHNIEKDIFFTIKWNGKEENIILKPQ